MALYTYFLFEMGLNLTVKIVNYILNTHLLAKKSIIDFMAVSEYMLSISGMIWMSPGVNKKTFILAGGNPQLIA